MLLSLAITSDDGTSDSRNPDPDTLKGPSVTLIGRLFVMRIVCEFVAPTGTFPKLTSEGVTVIGCDVPGGSAHATHPVIAVNAKENTSRRRAVEASAPAALSRLAARLRLSRTTLAAENNGDPWPNFILKVY